MKTLLVSLALLTTAFVIVPTAQAHTDTCGGVVDVDCGAHACYNGGGNSLTWYSPTEGHCEGTTTASYGCLVYVDVPSFTSNFLPGCIR